MPFFGNLFFIRKMVKHEDAMEQMISPNLEAGSVFSIAPHHIILSGGLLGYMLAIIRHHRKHPRAIWEQGPAEWLP